MNCLNCNTEASSNYCPNCGQRTSTTRITFKSFARRVTNDLIDTDKGILYNFKNLTLRPGIAVNNYIDGKRRHIFNPISYVFLAVTIHLLLSQKLGKNPNLNEQEFAFLAQQESYEIGKKLGVFIKDYIKFFFILYIPYLSIFERLFLTKWNIYELFTINSFILGHSVFIGILFYPFLRMPLITDPVIYLSIVVLSFFVFKKKYGKTESLFVPMFSFFMALILMFVIPSFFIYYLG